MPTKEPKKFVLVIASKPKEIMKVEGFLERMNTVLQLEESMYNKLLVATTEAVNNGILHGNQRDPKKKVILTCEINRETVTIHVQDEGPGVDPSKLPDPLADENLMRENGRGVFLMRSLMDEVTFERIPDGAIVTMTMKLQK